MQRDIALAAESAAKLSVAHKAKLGTKQRAAAGAKPDWAKKYRGVAGNAKRLAGKLSACADALGAPPASTAPLGRPAADADRTAYLLVIGREFRGIAPFLAADDPGLTQKAKARLLAEPAGQTGLREALYLKLTRHRGVLSDQARSPQQLTRETMALQHTLAASGESTFLETIREKLKELDSVRAAGGQERSDEWPARHLRALASGLDDEIEAARSGMAMPSVRALSKRYRGAGHQWLESLQEAQVGLLREVCLLGMEPPGRTATLRLSRQYARLIERRAREIYRQGRRNRPLDIEAHGVPPAIRLPEHLAREFFKARNLKSPEAFRTEIEAYYDELYRDLAD